LVVSIDDMQFQTLLEQVRELHQLADDLTRSPRIHANVRARLNWDPEPPLLPSEQRKIADAVVEVLEKTRLSSSQSRQLRQAFFGK
jgi:hypothetical protein